MELMKSKKGVIDQLVPLVTALVVLGIVLVIGFLIFDEIGKNDKVAGDANASKALNETIDAMDDIPGWLPIIVITVIGALLIGLVSMFRGDRR